MTRIISVLFLVIIICISCSTEQNHIDLKGAMNLMQYSQNFLSAERDSIYYSCNISKEYDTTEYIYKNIDIESVFKLLCNKDIVHSDELLYLNEFGFVKNLRYDQKNDTIIVEFLSLEDKYLFAIIKSNSDTLIANTQQKRAMRVPIENRNDKISTVNRCDTFVQEYLSKEFGSLLNRPKIDCHKIEIVISERGINIYHMKQKGDICIVYYGNRQLVI